MSNQSAEPDSDLQTRILHGSPPHTATHTSKFNGYTHIICYSTCDAAIYFSVSLSPQGTVTWNIPLICMVHRCHCALQLPLLLMKTWIMFMLITSQCRRWFVNHVWATEQVLAHECIAASGLQNDLTIALLNITRYYVTSAKQTASHKTHQGLHAVHVASNTASDTRPCAHVRAHTHTQRDTHTHRHMQH